jgi:hypothetical protein
MNSKAAMVANMTKMVETAKRLRHRVEINGVPGFVQRKGALRLKEIARPLLFGSGGCYRGDRYDRSLSINGLKKTS